MAYPFTPEEQRELRRTIEAVEASTQRIWEQVRWIQGQSLKRAVDRDLSRLNDQARQALRHDR